MPGTPIETPSVSGEAVLTDLFCRLASIPSPSGSEGACAAAVAGELTALGLAVDRDDAGAKVGSDSDNLYCRIEPNAGGTPLFFCAHLDTVPPTAPLEPIVRDGVVRNATPSVVGADNRAAMATRSLHWSTRSPLSPAASPPPATITSRLDTVFVAQGEGARLAENRFLDACKLRRSASRIGS
jgi:di/tripeptidase